MRLRSILLVFILSLSYLPVPMAQAQIGAPDVNLQCSPTSVGVDVYPGASLTGSTTCTVSNPNSYQEKIEIEVTADGLATTAPSSITLGPNEEQDFEVMVRANQNMAMQSRNMVVKATVTEVMGAPPPNLAEKEQQIIVEIRQFAGVQVEASQPFITIYGGTNVDIEFNVYNLGNQIDFFRFAIDSDSLEQLENEGFSVSLPSVKMQIDNSPAPSKARVSLTAPSDNSDWTINSDGMREASFKIIFEATSEFSCNVGNCISDDSSMTINVIQEVSATEDLVSSSSSNKMLIFGGSGAGLLILLMLVLSMKKKRK